MLLILLMLLLPWQAITAAERNFTHVIGNQESTASFIRHYSEHLAQSMHHHDDDDDHGVSHDDNSERSARHMADFDHGFSMNVLFPIPHAVTAVPVGSIAHGICPDSFDDRTTLPLRRPPRALV